MKKTAMSLIAIAMMMHGGLTHATTAAWTCSTSCKTELPEPNSKVTQIVSQCEASGPSTKEAILALKAKLAGKNRKLKKEECDQCMPIDIESAVCKNAKTGKVRSYVSMKGLMGEGANGEKGGE